MFLNDSNNNKKKPKLPKNNTDDNIDSTYFSGYLDHNVHKKMLCKSL